MKVRLKAPHTHAGVKYPAGATIDVPVLDAIWLKTLDLIEDGVAAIEAETKKLASPQNPKPYADELAKLAAQATSAPAAAPTAPKE